MRRTRISFLCAAVLAAVPAGAEAGTLGSVVGAVANAPRAIFGGLLGGGGGARARHHRTHARHATPERSVARPAGRAIARAAPAVPSQVKPANRETAAFWPAGYDDVFGYVLTPRGYDDAFWSHGYADVIKVTFTPGAADSAGNKRGPSAPTPVSAKPDDFPAARCTGVPDSAAAIERIERVVQPTDAQRAPLGELGSALRAASERVAATCALDFSGGPNARLEAIWRRLRALRQAAIMIRAPLTNFYDSLNDEQKARLDTDGQAAGSRTAREAGSDRWLLACSESARMPEWPVAAIAQAIQPTEDQRPMLELLMGTSLHYAHQLRASCAAAPAPLTPLARLEAVDQRLSAMIYALTILRGTLNKFYNALTDEQRGRFDVMGSATSGTEPRRAELR
jgi:hypothetical protein